MFAPRLAPLARPGAIGRTAILLLFLRPAAVTHDMAAELRMQPLEIALADQAEHAIVLLPQPRIAALGPVRPRRRVPIGITE